jgi:peptidoglycan hydrolase CwlO-like protein
MMKKLVIAVLAVAVGVAVLAWVSPVFFGWAKSQVQKTGQALDSSVPLEDRIDMLQAKLKDLDKNEGKYFDAVGKQDYEVKKLSKEVASLSDHLDAQWKKVEKMRDDLGDATKTSFTTKDGYNRTWARADVEEQFDRDFKSFKNMEQELEAKKKILAANEKELVTAKEELHSLGQLRDSMAAKIATMKADLAEVRRKENETGAKLDSSEYARLTDEINDVADQIGQRKSAIEVRGEAANGPVDPLADKPAPTKDRLKDFDEFKNAHKGDAGKAVVSDK